VSSVAAMAGRFFLVTVLLTLGVAAAGYVPTVRLGGEGAKLGLFAGCAVSLVGSWIGSVPVLLAVRAGGGAVNAVMVSMALRFVIVAGLALAIAISDVVSKGPFLIWVAISYVVLLIVDVMLALRCSSQAISNEGKGTAESNNAGIE